jgi:hypothetical protein
MATRTHLRAGAGAASTGGMTLNLSTLWEALNQAAREPTWRKAGDKAGWNVSEIFLNMKES